MGLLYFFTPIITSTQCIYPHQTDRPAITCLLSRGCCKKLNSNLVPSQCFCVPITLTNGSVAPTTDKHIHETVTSQTKYQLSGVSLRPQTLHAATNFGPKILGGPLPNGSLNMPVPMSWPCSTSKFQTRQQKLVRTYNVSQKSSHL